MKVEVKCSPTAKGWVVKLKLMGKSWIRVKKFFKTEEDAFEFAYSIIEDSLNETETNTKNRNIQRRKR